MSKLPPKEQPDIRTIGMAVATHLNGFEYDSEDSTNWRANLNGEGGRSILLYLERGRVIVSGTYAKDKQGRNYIPAVPEQRLRITVSPHRPPSAIAREIDRRFFPEYLKEYRASQERAEEADANRAWSADALQQFASILGTKVKTKGPFTDEIFHYLKLDLKGDNRNICIKPNPYTRTVELFIKGANLSKALKLVKELKKD